MSEIEAKTKWWLGAILAFYCFLLVAAVSGSAMEQGIGVGDSDITTVLRAIVVNNIDVNSDADTDGDIVAVVGSSAGTSAPEGLEIDVKLYIIDGEDDLVVENIIIDSDVNFVITPESSEHLPIAWSRYTVDAVGDESIYTISATSTGSGSIVVSSYSFSGFWPWLPEEGRWIKYFPKELVNLIFRYSEEGTSRPIAPSLRRSGTIQDHGAPGSRPAKKFKAMYC